MNELPKDGPIFDCEIMISQSTTTEFDANGTYRSLELETGGVIMYKDFYLFGPENPNYMCRVLMIIEGQERRPKFLVYFSREAETLTNSSLIFHVRNSVTKFLSDIIEFQEYRNPIISNALREILHQLEKEPGQPGNGKSMQQPS